MNDKALDYTSANKDDPRTYGRILSVEVEFKAKPSHPTKPSPSPEGTVGESIEPPVYAEEQLKTWRELFRRQEDLLEGKACAEYTRGRERLHIPCDRPAYLGDMSRVLRESTGWSCVRVEGYVPEKIFFTLLAKKQFPTTDFLRHPTEIEYTPAPDMFHDIVGHLPMITDTRFASFFHAYGLAGTRARTDQDIAELGRIYWFTVEFGLINPTAHAGVGRDPKATQIYGSGIVSSVGEIPHSLSDKVRHHPFNIEEIAVRPFDIHHMQTDYFEIASFEELESEFRRWGSAKGLLG